MSNVDVLKPSSKASSGSPSVQQLLHSRLKAAAPRTVQRGTDFIVAILLFAVLACLPVVGFAALTCEPEGYMVQGLSRCTKITSPSCLPCCPSSALQQKLHNAAMRLLLRLE